MISIRALGKLFWQASGKTSVSLRFIGGMFGT